MKLTKNYLLVLVLLSAAVVSLLDCSGRVKTFKSIEVTPSEPVISLPTTTLQFKATGTFNDGLEVDATKSVIWSSSDTAIASVSNDTDSKGLATIVAEGVASIIATSDITGISGSTTLTVAPVTVAPAR
jgi:hypothetical protein